MKHLVNLERFHYYHNILISNTLKYIKHKLIIEKQSLQLSHRIKTISQKSEIQKN